MIKIENLDVFNLKGAICGMRNPYDSWGKSDSSICKTLYKMYDGTEIMNDDGIKIGEKDLELMKKLYKAGSEHAKYLRQIFVSFDVVAPLYWWKESDQYKVGVTSNSCSTMHTLTKRDLTIDDFSHEHLSSQSIDALRRTIDVINGYRSLYVSGGNAFDKGNKEFWWQMIQLLPSSYNQRRRISMSYANLTNIIKQRKGHKLDCWREFCKFMLDNAPYLKEIMGE